MSQPARLFNRNYVLLLQGHFVSLLGSAAYMVALMLWIKDATGSEALAGTILMIGGFATFLSSFAGTLADRWPRVRMIVSLDLMSGFTMLGLAALYFIYPDQTWLLILALTISSALRGIFDAFFRPVVLSLVPDVSPPDKLSSANAGLQTCQRLTRVLGHAGGALVYEWIGAAYLFLVDGISYVVSGITEMFIRTPKRAPRKITAEQASVVEETREGFRYVWNRKDMRAYFLMAATNNFNLICFVVLLPFYVEKHLHASNIAFGMIAGTVALGTLIGTLLGGFLRLKPGVRGALMMTGILLTAPLRGGLYFCDTPMQAIILFFPTGLIMGFWGVHIVSILQSQTPPELRGRVMGLQTMLRGGLMPIGMGFYGLVAEWSDGQIGLIYLIAASISGGIMAWATLSKDYRRMLRI